jgi:hypothetical protein
VEVSWGAVYDDPERALARAMANQCPSCGRRSRRARHGWRRCRASGRPYPVEFKLHAGEILWRMWR